MVARSQAADRDALRCSFCNKGQNDVGKLIAGPSVFICDECIAVCNDIIADDAKAAAEVGTERPRNIGPDLPFSGLSLQCSLCRTPTDASEGLLIPNRGILCVGCIGEIEATIAERRESEA
jgi:hypothetical protein